jgi:hypothetical protein
MGGAAHVIAEIADKERADLIVAGTRGHAPLSGLLLVLWRFVGAPVLPRLGNFLVSDFRATTFTGERNRKARHRGLAFLVPEEAVEKSCLRPSGSGSAEGSEARSEAVCRFDGRQQQHLSDQGLQDRLASSFDRGFLSLRERCYRRLENRCRVCLYERLLSRLWPCLRSTQLWRLG